MSKWVFFSLMGWMLIMQGCGYLETFSGDDQQVRRVVPLMAFDTVVIETSVRLVLTRDSISLAELEGPAFVLSKLNITQEERTLSIEAGGAGFSQKKMATVTLHSASFKKLISNFPSEIVSYDTLRTDTLSIVINGRGSFTDSHLTLKAQSLSIFCFGDNVGTHVFKGTVNDLMVQAEGLASIDAKELEADKVQYVQKSLNPGFVYAKTQLGVQMGGLGNVYFWGQPQVNVVNQPPSYQVELGEVLSWSSIN